MSPAKAAESDRLIAHRPFLFYFLMRAFSEFSLQITAVAVGWQVYTLTGSAFALGMVGLAQFVPTALLTFVAGHVADRYDRRRIVQLCQFVEALGALVLAVGSFSGWLNVTEIFAIVGVFGTAVAFENPAASALLPAVAPEGMLPRANAVTTAAFQIAIVSGPALGGLAYGLAPGVPYAVMAFFWLSGAILTGAIQIERAPAPAAAEPGALFAGVRFVRQNPALLGTISLDLFAVLLGGATALMPIYAHDILHVGPWGLGLLRGAPAIGALMMTAVLARRPITRQVGLRMFQAVIVFGAATIVFGLSQSVWLSLGALVVMGAADTISVVIRTSLVQLATPDDMRGRVGAVNFLFINASGQLGEFESGMAAALMGAMPAVVLGGVGTIVVALLWMRLFPTLRHYDQYA